VVGSTSSASNMHEVGNKNSNPYRNMVMDAMRMSEGNVRECPITLKGLKRISSRQYANLR